MEENLAHVLKGFFNLPAREKLKLVEAINEYFDSNDRESVRAAREAEFERLGLPNAEVKCPCCGR